MILSRPGYVAISESIDHENIERDAMLFAHEIRANENIGRVFIASTGSVLVRIPIGQSANFDLFRTAKSHGFEPDCIDVEEDFTRIHFDPDTW